MLGLWDVMAAVNALRLADALCAADPKAVVLVCAVELCSLHFQFNPGPEQLIANALFADGAAAAIVSGTQGESSFESSLEIRDFASFRFPDTDDAMSWKVGNSGFEMSLSARLPAVIEERLESFVSAWLDENGYAAQDISHWAVHPGGPRILSAVERGLALESDMLSTSRAVLSEFGNMSSATLLFILKQMRVRRLEGPVVMLGFGPGVFAEAALLDTAP